MTDAPQEASRSDLAQRLIAALGQCDRVLVERKNAVGEYDVAIFQADSARAVADLVPDWSSDMDAAPERTPVLGWNKNWPHAQVMIWCKAAHVPLYGWHGLPFIDEDDDMLKPAPTHWMPLLDPPKEGE